MSKSKLRLSCLLAVAFFLSSELRGLTPPVRSDTPPARELAEKIEAVIRRPDYKHARWGILVVDDAGKTIYEHNAEELFAPASVTKLFTCAAALTELGADYRFETPVFARGKLTGAKLSGDLILVAKGDLTLGGRTNSSGKMAFTDSDHIYASPANTETAVPDTDPLAGLAELARLVKKAGVHQVLGDVLIDDRLFEHSRGTGSGPAVVTPIMVNDNIVDVILTPAAKALEPAMYRLRPDNSFVQVDVQVETVAKGEPVRVTSTRVGPRSYSVRGQVPIGAGPVVRICPVEDPAGFARALFIDCLRREGVLVRASALRTPTAELPEVPSYDAMKRVALFRSPPFSEALKVTLKVSHNLYASAMPLLIAVKHGQRTQPQGMRLQGKVLAKLGVHVRNISLESGAGGGNGDKLSPRAVVRLLQAMRKRDDWSSYEHGLPILGVDGTLASVGKDGPARGKVHAKTGTYTDANLLLDRLFLRAKTLAGVMTTAKGQTLVFAIFVNDVPLPAGVLPTREGKVIGQLCEIIQQNVP
jgi:D-alanyl-D-alanine carboxypeptidase/D-alanyl-D-alanine-endopeptidase (penicillin-binding protein 4)